MPLDTRLTIADFDYAYERQAEYEQAQPLTVFAGRKPIFIPHEKRPDTPVRKPIFMRREKDPDTPMLYGDGIEGHHRYDVVDPLSNTKPVQVSDRFLGKPLQVSDKFSQTMDVPVALGLSLTDKDSRGVYEMKPLQRKANPINATLLNNPAVDSLETINFGGSPLGNNFAGTQSIASGSDPARFFSNAATPYQFVGDETLPVEEAETPCGMFDFPCKFKKVKGEVTILVVGVIILGIGIFALTR